MVSMMPEFASGELLGHVLLSCTHNPRLVLVSYVVACLGSFVALRLASRIRADSARGRLLMVGLGAVSMGGGIWSMHFIGMLAWETPVAVAFNWGLTAISLVVAILGALAAFVLIVRFGNSITSIFAGGAIMGTSIVLMHYTGMASMESALRIVYERELFLLSILIALAAATAAVFITLQVQRAHPQRQFVLTVGASLIMGLAIIGMHYTGMAAVLPYIDVPLSQLPGFSGTNFDLVFDVLIATVVTLGLGVLAIQFQDIIVHQAGKMEEIVSTYEQILSIPDGVLLVDASGALRAFNDAAARMFRLQNQADKTPIGEMIPDYAEPPPDDQANRFKETTATTRDGRTFPLEYSYAKSGNEDQDFSVIVCRDISERQEMIQQIQELLKQNTELALTDTLTGLSNRRAINDAIEREIAHSRRSNNPFSLLLIDIDHFKKINDNFGHLTGDRALQEIAVVMKKALRGTDIPARFGGEELLVLLPETDLPTAQKIAERLRLAVERVVFESPDNGEEVRMTCSIGVCLSAPDESPEDLFSRVDKAMYEAKRNGRNQVSVAA